MKKFYLIFLTLMLSSLSGLTQIKKGNFVLGGNVNYQTTSSRLENSGVSAGNDINWNRFSLSPLAGYFLSEQTVVGLKVEYFSSYNESISIPGQMIIFENNRFGIGPFVRRYFPVQDWVAFYGQAEVNYGSTNNLQKSDTSSNIETKSETVNFVASFGLSFFPTEWMSVDLSANPLSFYHQNSSGDPASSEITSNGFTFNLNSNSFFIGAHFFLNKK